MPHTGFQPEQHGFAFVNAWLLGQEQVAGLLLRALCARAMTGIGAARSHVPHIIARSAAWQAPARLYPLGQGAAAGATARFPLKEGIAAGALRPRNDRDQGGTLLRRQPDHPHRHSSHPRYAVKHGGAARATSRAGKGREGIPLADAGDCCGRFAPAQ